MAFITLDRKKLTHNFNFLNQLFKSRNITWGIVSKILCGSEIFIKELVQLGIQEIHDSRISNLKIVKKINPNIQTVYIKPPAKRIIPNLVKYADVSFNSETYTINLINEEAARQKKKHKIIIMIEMGDLREGIMGEHLTDFYTKIINLKQIEIAGIGTNLNCLSGVMPTHDKLVQLSLYKQLVEAKLNITIPWVSGGTSVTIPLMLQNLRPLAVNHFRVGETLFFGNNLFTNHAIKGMAADIFTLYAEIIEVTKKPNIPIGELGTNVAGEKIDLEKIADKPKSSYRAILDVGLLDIAPKYLKIIDKDVQIIDASSDMLVVDLGKKKDAYKVGDFIAFHLQYMGALSLLNSNYIEKKVV